MLGALTKCFVSPIEIGGAWHLFLTLNRCDRRIFANQVGRWREERRRSMDMRLPDRPSMLQYRLYCLGGDGSFTKVHELEARSDADALEQARAMKLGVQCELWARNRLVGELAPDGSLNGKPHVPDRIN